MLVYQSCRINITLRFLFHTGDNHFCIFKIAFIFKLFQTDADIFVFGICFFDNGFFDRFLRHFRRQFGVFFQSGFTNFGNGKSPAGGNRDNNRRNQSLAAFPALFGTNGIGFAFGLWIKSVKEGESDAQAAFKVMYRAFELGLYTMRLGSNWLRIEPSLNIDREVLAKALSILNTALADYEAGRISDEVLTWMLK